MTTKDPRVGQLSLRVAAEVRASLARQRISARRAAMTIGWSQVYLSRRLNGEVSFSLDDLDALSELLEVPVTAFFEGPVELPRDLYIGRQRSLAGGTTKPKYSTPVRPEISEMSFSAPSGPVRTQAA